MTGTSSATADHQPHLTMGPRQLAVLFAKGLVSDRRERQDLARWDDGRPWWRAADPRLHGPIFIVGAPRSGTTFLGRSVGAVPGLSYHFEPRLTKTLVRYVYTGAWAAPRAARVFRGSYRTLLLAAGDGGRRFVDKTPENSFIIPFLAATFPTARFVHIVRDGRDVAVSHAEKPWLSARSAGLGRRGRGGAEWGPYPRFWVEPEGRARFTEVSDLERSAWCWRRFTTSARQDLTALPAHRWCEIRYEELAVAPVPQAARLAAFLTLDSRQHQALASALTQASTASLGRWRSALPAAERELVERECAPLLGELGYR